MSIKNHSISIFHIYHSLKSMNIIILSTFEIPQIIVNHSLKSMSVTIFILHTYRQHLKFFK